MKFTKNTIINAHFSKEEYEVLNKALDILEAFGEQLEDYEDGVTSELGDTVYCGDVTSAAEIVHQLIASCAFYVK